MKPEWITAAVAITGAIGAILNLVVLVVSLRIRTDVAEMRQEVLDRVDEKYMPRELCAAEMAPLRPLRAR